MIIFCVSTNDETEQRNFHVLIMHQPNGAHRVVVVTHSQLCFADDLVSRKLVCSPFI